MVLLTSQRRTGLISTTCKLCTFKEMHGNVQTGCSLGKLQKFAENGAEIDNFVEDGFSYKKINRVCMFLRETWDWSKDIHEETFIKSTIIVIHKNGTLFDLERTLISIKSLSTPKPPKVVVCHTLSSLDEVYSLSSKYIEPSRLTCTKVIEETYESSADDEAFKAAKNGWVFFIDSGEMLKPDVLEVLNHAVNIEMGTFFFTESPNAYLAVIYKYLHGQKGCSIKEKLSKEKPANWEELNEAYRIYYRKTT